MALQPDPNGDYIDEKGHTVEQAQAQVPNLDADAEPASKKAPEGGGDVMVPAQSAEEVRAQIENRAGAEGDSHDLSEQLVAAAKLGTDEDGDAADGEAAEIAEADEELDPDGDEDEDPFIDLGDEDEDEDEDSAADADAADEDDAQG